MQQFASFSMHEMKYKLTVASVSLHPVAMGHDVCLGFVISCGYFQLQA